LELIKLDAVDKSFVIMSIHKDGGVSHAAIKNVVDFPVR